LIGLLAGLGTVIGVLVAVFGLPYGRMNYSAFAGVYHNPMGTGTHAPAGHYALDCSPAAGVQDTCTRTDVDLTDQVINVVFSDNSAGYSIAAFAFKVQDPNEGDFDPLPTGAITTGKNNNPDFDEALEGAPNTPSYNCSTLPPNSDVDGSATNAISTLDCFLGIGSAAANPQTAGSDTRVATITYAMVSPTIGSTLFTFTDGVVGDGTVNLVSCLGGDGLLGPGDSDMDTVDDAADNGQCFPATINIEAGPTATFTNTPTNTVTSTFTPTATNTPAGPTMNKIPEWCFPGVVNNDNADCGIPSANLWICLTGPCAGPGEGNLIVHEYATNIDTAPIGPGGIGLGAYEFDLEYDNLVIQSVNPSDIVFNPGPIAPYPNGADGVADGEGAARAPATCGFSLIFENVIHFGCVTSDPDDGPEGAMDIARLNLIPHEDLPNDLFPGNDNGVVTVLKDNGCELVDTLGHPVLGSVNGGLTLECGDIAVTVRILEGDLDLDCDVDVQDQQLIAFRYGSFFGSLLYSQWYDLEPNLHDLDIDIKDLQKVFGRDGSTCQDPVPPQPPAPPPAPF
jgi:hypothetical protein